MKNKISEKSKRYIIVPIAALGLIAVLALGSVDSVSARGSFEQRPGFTEHRQQRIMGERHDEMEARLEEKLEQAVVEGSLTEAQRYAILEKHEELADRMQEIHDQDISRDEMHELKADLHEEMQVWAEENGIDYETVMRVGKRMMGGGYGQHRYALDNE